MLWLCLVQLFFCQAEDGIRGFHVTGVQTCALPIWSADDWVYIVERSAPSRARAYALPSGEKSRFVRDVREALDKASAAFERHLGSDQHRISLDLLEEEMRERGASPVEQLRRRAEAQNIALVKSLDGYVLAPMHDGRVVRSDVFRALPEALKRNVEAKITTLEEE